MKKQKKNIKNKMKRKMGMDMDKFLKYATEIFGQNKKNEINRKTF